MPKEVLDKKRPSLEGKIKRINNDSMVLELPNLGAITLSKKYLPEGMAEGDSIRVAFTKALSFEEEKKEIAHSVLEALLNPGDSNNTNKKL